MIVDLPAHDADPAEVLRYLGRGTQQVSSDIEGRLETQMGRARELARPRASIKCCPIASRDAEKSTISLEGCALDLEGTSIAEHLAGARAVALMAVTIGMAVERELRRLALLNSLDQALFDAAATTLVECAAEDAEALYARTKDFWPESAASFDDEYKFKIFSIIYDRLKTLGDLKTMTTYFFEDPKVDMDMITNNKALKKLSEHEVCDLLRKAWGELSSLDDWTAENIQAALNALLESTGQKPMILFGLIRLSVSFAPFSPALHDTLAVLGKETSLARMNAVRTAFARD